MRYLTRKSKSDAVSLYISTGEVWKLDAGAKCNRLLEHALNIEQNSDYWAAYKASTADDIRSIVKLVAEFEELETEQ